MNALFFKCARCKQMLKRPGAIILSPPKEPSDDVTAEVYKFHICRNCWSDLKNFIDHK